MARVRHGTNDRYLLHQPLPRILVLLMVPALISMEWTIAHMMHSTKSSEICWCHSRWDSLAVLDGRPLVCGLLVVRSGHQRPSFRAAVIRGTPCRDPLGCRHIQGDATTKRQPLCGCLCVLAHVVLCRRDDRGHGLVMWASVDRAHTSSAREICLFSSHLMFAHSIARVIASSTALPRD